VPTGRVGRALLERAARTDDRSALRRVDPSSLRHQVATRLRTAILAGDLSPGTRLREQRIADTMGVSRVPVREAIRQLEQEGLIEVFPYRGAVVVGISPDELDAAYEVRGVIEGAAMRQLAAAADPAVITELRKQVDAMRHAQRRALGVERLADLDIRFHRTLLDASGLRVLGKIRDSLDEILRVRSFYQGIQRGGPTGRYLRETFADSHAKLVDVLASGDPAAAADAARWHVMEVVERLGR
jgi:DNA-binding GntR family transcriptional regulator